MIKNFIPDITNYIEDIKTVIDKLDKNEINNFVEVLLEAYNNNKQVFVMGNGGSASTATHFVCDFNKGLNKNKKFRFICLNDNIATMLAYANDMSYDDVFVEQLKNYLNEGDVVIGISGSGNSPNIIKAIEYANEHNAQTVGLSGYLNNKLKVISKHSVCVNINNMQVTEDIHTILMHIAMKSISNAIKD